MAAGIYPQEFDYICVDCFLPEYQCPDYRNTPRNRALCPLEKIYRAKLSQSETGRLWQLAGRYSPEYRKRHFIRLMAIQAERNLL